MPTKSTHRPRDAARAVRIQVQCALQARGIPAAARLRAWARAAARGATRLTLRVVGAAEGRRLNRSFRGSDHATNVLTFVYATSPRCGDIVLCHPVIAREARAQGKALAAHYAHLVVHGMLHLRGYDHLRRSDARRMEGAETRILRSFGIANPYRLAAPAAR